MSKKEGMPVTPGTIMYSTGRGRLVRPEMVMEEVKPGYTEANSQPRANIIDRESIPYKKGMPRTLIYSAGRGRLVHPEMAVKDAKPAELVNSGYIEATTEPPVHLSPKKLISRSLKSTERRLSISEEDVLTSDDSESLEVPDEIHTSQDLESKKIPDETDSLTILQHDNVSPKNQNENDPLTPSVHDSASPEIQNKKGLLTLLRNNIVPLKSPHEIDPVTQFTIALNEDKPFLICAAEFLTNPETTEDVIIDWIEYIVRMALTSTDFCITFASYFKTLTQHVVFGKTIKRVTIDYLQEHFEERFTSFEDKPSDFNGSVTLLGQIFLRYHINDKPLRVFAQPLLEYLIMICSKLNEENVKIIAEQVSLNGKTMENIVPETMMELIECVQRQLLDTTSDRMRAWLLLIVNLCFYGQPLSPEISEIFSTTVGLKTIKEMAPPTKEKLYGEITDEFVAKFGNVFPLAGSLQ